MFYFDDFPSFYYTYREICKKALPSENTFNFQYMEMIEEYQTNVHF